MAGVMGQGPSEIMLGPVNYTSPMHSVVICTNIESVGPSTNYVCKAGGRTVVA